MTANPSYYDQLGVYSKLIMHKQANGYITAEKASHYGQKLFEWYSEFSEKGSKK